jgi:hypothetical protein
VLLLITVYLCFLFASITSDGYIEQNCPVLWSLTYLNVTDAGVFSATVFTGMFSGTVCLVSLMGSGLLMIEIF